jgi:hypothetical protein
MIMRTTDESTKLSSPKINTPLAYVRKIFTIGGENVRLTARRRFVSPAFTFQSELQVTRYRSNYPYSMLIALSATPEITMNEEFQVSPSKIAACTREVREARLSYNNCNARKDERRYDTIRHECEWERGGTRQKKEIESAFNKCRDSVGLRAD